MPWMIYFQQSAVVARRLQNPEQMAEERTGTLLGSILTQMIMIGALVTLAASHTINKAPARLGGHGGAWGGAAAGTGLYLEAGHHDFGAVKWPKIWKRWSPCETHLDS